MMTEQQTALFLILLFVIVVPLTLGVALWIVMRFRKRADQPAVPDAAGGLAVPVRGLTRRFRLMGYTKNSLTPQLAIGEGGMRFTVLKPAFWRFADIVRVGAPRTLFGTRLIVRHAHDGVLEIDMAGETQARALLRALPAGLRLTRRATALRDGGG